MRSGHFRSEWILITDLSTPLSTETTGAFGRYASKTNSNPSRATPTRAKYLIRGISGQLRPRERTDHSLNRFWRNWFPPWGGRQAVDLRGLSRVPLVRFSAGEAKAASAVHDVVGSPPARQSATPASAPSTG